MPVRSARHKPTFMGAEDALNLDVYRDVWKLLAKPRYPVAVRRNRHDASFKAIGTWVRTENPFVTGTDQDIGQEAVDEALKSLWAACQQYDPSLAIELFRNVLTNGTPITELANWQRKVLLTLPEWAQNLCGIPPSLIQLQVQRPTHRQ